MLSILSTHGLIRTGALLLLLAQCEEDARSPSGLDSCTTAPLRDRIFFIVLSVALMLYVVSPNLLFAATDAVVSTAAGPFVPTSRRRTLPVVFTLSILPALQQIP